MPERIALVALDAQQPYLDVKLEGKEYTIRCDEKGIHIFCLQSVKVQLADISEKSRWLIVK